MTDAPASPIATQETVEEIAARELYAHARATFHANTGPLWGECSDDARDRWRAAARIALSSAERRNEELVRERDEALTEHTDMMWQRRRAEERADAAEATIASLTGQVGEMRERAAKLCDAAAAPYAYPAETNRFENGCLFQARELAKEIRALEPSPGISTTGGDGASGREDDTALATTPAPTLDGAERR